MADPNDPLSQLDVQNLPPEQAAALIRAHQQALAQQQHHALLGMLGTVPELQKAGEAQYAQAGRERGTNQELGAQVLKQALGQQEAAARIKQLDIQGKQMLGMLGIAGAELGLKGQQQGFQQQYEKFRAESEAQRAVPEDLVKSAADTEVTLKTMESAGVPDIVKNIFKARLQAQKDTLKKYGYKTEGPPRWGGGGAPPPPVGVAGSPPGVPAPAKLHVRNKQTGQEGFVSPHFFDPNKYDKLP